MAIVFLFSSCGAAVTGTLAVRRYMEYRLHRQQLSRAEIEQKHLGDFLAKEAEEARDRASTVELGTFTIEIKPLPDERHRRGVMDLGELDIVAKCNDRKTREFIDAHVIEARNQVTETLTALDRNQLMTLEGKRRTKRRMIEKLNAWLDKARPGGKVQELYFTRLIVS